MAHLMIASNNKNLGRVDGSMKAKVYDFLDKINENDTALGLHIEPIKGAQDSKVRTGRVDDNYRAVMFKTRGGDGQPTYVYIGTWKHDVANSYAERAVLKVNDVSGVLEWELVDEPLKEPSPAPAPVPGPGSTPSLFLTYGFTLSDLRDRIGIDPAVAQLAMAASDESALEAVAAKAIDWQGMALIDLAVGLSIEEVIDRYSVKPPTNIDATDEEKLIEALEHPTTKMQFAFIDDNEELRRVIEGGDFAAWRTFLHPEQRAYVEGHRNGAFRVSGGAGTGKTVVAIHRANFLMEHEPNTRIVLTTFNKTLAAGMQTDLRVLNPSIPLASAPGKAGVYVRGIDALARAIVSAVSSAELADATTALFGHAQGLAPVKDSSDSLWRDALGSVDHGLEPRIASPAFFDAEYVDVVLANRIATIEDYARVPRPGRGVRLTRPQRIGVWKVINAFRRANRMDDSATFPDVVAAAAEVLRRRSESGGSHLADHVIVDEAQDLHSPHWGLLRALVAPGSDDLFIAEDSHQRIYGHKIVLGRLGISIVGRSRRLTLNYRTTAQNLRFALGVLEGGDYSDIEGSDESTKGYRSARTGPTPRLLPCATLNDELDSVAATITSWTDVGADPSTIAVLTRGVDARNRMVRALTERRVQARALDDSPIPAGLVAVLTMHRAKGMEFSRVVLAGIGKNSIPSAASVKSVPEEERADALQRERSLLYVASSRARDELVVTWVGEQSDLLGTHVLEPATGGN